MIRVATIVIDLKPGRSGEAREAGLLVTPPLLAYCVLIFCLGFLQFIIASEDKKVV